VATREFGVFKEFVDFKDGRVGRGLQVHREFGGSKEFVDFKATRDGKVRLGFKVAVGSRVFKAGVDSKDCEGFRDSGDSKDIRAFVDFKDSKVGKAFREFKEFVVFRA
jgi:hypothetical protein